MLIAWLICLFFSSSAAAFGYDIVPAEKVYFIPNSMPAVIPSVIELVEIDKTKLPLTDATLVKLATLRKEFADKANTKSLTPQTFTPEEIQQLFAKEWAYPGNKQSDKKQLRSKD